MEPTRTLERYERTHAEWVRRVGALDDAAVVRRPEGGGWSVGEVCSHVGEVADVLLGEAELCVAGDGEARRTGLMAWLLFRVGSFPPVRIPLPELPERYRGIERPPALDKAAALSRLEGVLERMRELCAPVAEADRAVKRQHPAGFWLDARRFYQNNEMHARHHLRQLARLEGDLQQDN